MSLAIGGIGEIPSEPGAGSRHRWIEARTAVARRSLAIGAITIAVVVMSGAAPDPAHAFPAGGGTEASTGTAPAGGAEVTNTDNIPAGATAGSVLAQPLPGDDPHAFDEITGALVEGFPWLQNVSRRNQARLACVLIAFLPLANKPEDQPITFEDVHLQVALLNVCLRMAQSIPAPPAAGDRATAARTACGREDAAVTVKVSHLRSGYLVKVISKIGKVTHPGLAVSCRRSGRGLLLGVKPAKRGQTLAQAGGPGLGIAYSNPTSKPLRIHTTFHAN